MTGRSGLRRCGVAAAVLLLVGAGLTVLGYRHRSFGWFAYTPISEQTFEPFTGLLVVGREEAVGLVLLVLGLVLGAACWGVRTGRRDAGRTKTDGWVRDH